MDQTQRPCQACGRHPAARDLAQCIHCLEKARAEANNRRLQEAHQEYRQARREARRGQ